MLNTAASKSAQLRGSMGTTSCREAMWFLVGRLGEQESIRQLPVYITPFQIGRRSSASLCLPCSSVSSLHAELTDTGTALMLRDLGSTNGTFVNGQRIKDSVELRPDDLVQFASIPFRIAKQSVSTIMGTVSEDVCDYALLLVQFDKLMAEEAVIPHYQPIVNLADGALIGHEVLARSTILGLESPAAMFRVAAQLNLQTKLSQMMRCKAIAQTMTLEQPPHLFVNTHPAELAAPNLIDSMGVLRDLSPRQEITLEIHEAAVTEAAAMRNLRSALVDLDVKLAFDDFGAGQARLAELTEVRPDYLKFDISLVRNLDKASIEKVQMVGSLVRMVREMEIIPLAEGIETDGERKVCVDLGFTLAQGYFFGKPVALYSR